ncbi:Protein kinase domain-containing protein [Cladophialophora immunda]|nr:Protein kinase domain-containing protein [Cladophialophora immunda]
MAPKPSKWATDDDNDAAAAQAERKREKAERKRLKEEKARNAAPSTTPFPSAADDNERPTKRPRTSSFDEEENGAAPAVQPQVEGEEEGAHLLRFPSRQFGPCGHVDQFEMLNKIEEGSYGVVARARRKTSGEIVALKRLKMDHTNDGFPVTGLREIQTLMACRDANVVKLLEVVVGDSLKDVCLVMEFLEHDLKTLLDEMAEPFLPSETKTLMLQIVSGVEYLHRNWILHRDLKTSNLLLNNRGEVKLADFGMARYTSNPPPKLTQLVVTLWYRAPELLLGAEEYDFEVDIWSLGCIFAELLTKEPLFQGHNELDQLSKMFSLLGTPTREAWPGFRSLPNTRALHPLLSSPKSATRSSLTASKFPYLTSAGLRLLSSLLSLNPASRPRAAEILNHPYFREDPRPKSKELFPTFPSKAGQEKRRKKETPQAPVRGDAPRLDEKEVEWIFKGWDAEGEEKGGGFALRLG